MSEVQKESKGIIYITIQLVVLSVMASLLLVVVQVSLTGVNKTNEYQKEISEYYKRYVIEKEQQQALSSGVTESKDSGSLEKLVNSNSWILQYISHENLGWFIDMTETTYSVLMSLVETHKYKMMIFINALPVLGLFALTGMIDGLNKREIRTAELGRESSYVFHKISKWSLRIIVTVLVFWVLVPLKVSPIMVFGMANLGILLSVMYASSKFKKYL